MAQTVSVTRPVRRSFAVVGEFMADPHRFMPVVSTLGRCRYVGDGASGGELWDVFLDVGTIQLGGRVLVISDPGTGLHWKSLRGTRHRFRAQAEPAGPDGSGDTASRITMTLTFSTTGFGVGWLTELVGRGILGRNLYAASEELRHHLEFEA